MIPHKPAADKNEVDLLEHENGSVEQFSFVQTAQLPVPQNHWHFCDPGSLDLSSSLPKPKERYDNNGVFEEELDRAIRKQDEDGNDLSRAGLPNLGIESAIEHVLSDAPSPASAWRRLGVELERTMPALARRIQEYLAEPSPAKIAS